MTVGFLIDGGAAELDLADARRGPEAAPVPDDAADAHRNDCRAEQSEPEVPTASPEPEPGTANRPNRRPRRPRAHITLADYIRLVRAMVEAETAPAAQPPDKVRRWQARTKILRKRQRARVRNWIADRSLQFRETPLPA